MKKNPILISLLFILASVGMASCGKQENTVPTRDTDLIIISDDSVSNKELLSEVERVVGLNYRKIDEFNGLSNGIEIAVNKDSINKIKALKGVKAASINKAHTLNENEEFKTFDDSKTYNSGDNDSIAEMKIPEGSKEGEGLLIAILDSSFTKEHNAFVDLDSGTKKKINKDFVSSKTLHAKTPVYYNDKIPFLWDYAGRINYRNGQAMGNVEDDNVESNLSYHGMHVASIACANSTYFKGVAPKAQLAFMKVFGDVYSNDSKSYIGQRCLDSYIVHALNDCYELGVDIINLSLGNDFDEYSENEASYAVFQKLVENGVQVNCAQGNSGKGNWKNSGTYAYDSPLFVDNGTVGGYAALEITTGVAASRLSVDDSVDPTISCDGHTVPATNQIDDKPFAAFIPEEQDGITLPFEIVPGLGAVEDYDEIDVKGKVAVISRGTLYFYEKIQNAFDHGAIATIIYNNEAGDAIGGFDLSGGDHSRYVPTLMASYESGQILKNAKTREIYVSKEMIADFSSNGPTSDLRIKPEITAPGENIIAAVNVDPNASTSTIVKNKYAYLGGTSMATPNYCGAVAVLMSELDKDNARSDYIDTLKARIMTTATPLLQTNGSDMSIRRQGAGVVNVENALKGLYLTYGAEQKGKVELKNNDDIKNGKIDFEVTIHNEKGLTGTYETQLTVTVAETVEADSANQREFAGKLFQTTSQRLIDTIKGSVTLNGSKEQKVKVSYTLDSEEKANILSVFKNGIYLEGYLKFRSENLPNLNIPYLGFLGDWDAISCVEPFDFEKPADDDNLYESSILNKLLTETGLNSPNANFESCIVGTKYKLNTDEMTNVCDEVFSNSRNIKEMCTPLDTVTDSEGNYWLFAGKRNTTNTIIIHQMVNRNVRTNDLKFIDSKGKIVLEDHMFDNIYGGDDNYSLYKSVATSDNISQDSEGNDIYYMASRAYTIIPLDNYEDGDYTIDMSFTLNNGAVQKFTYKLQINKSGKYNKDRGGKDVTPEAVTEIKQKVTKEQATGGYDATDIFKDARANNKTVSFVLTDGKVAFDKKATKEIGGSRVTFKFKVETEDEAILGTSKLRLDVELLGSEFSTGKATVTINHRLDIPTWATPVLYYKNGDDYEKVDATFTSSTITFETNHFSTYVVMLEGEEPVVPDDPVGPVNPDDPIIIVDDFIVILTVVLSIAAVVVIAGSIILVVLVLRKRK